MLLCEAAKLIWQLTVTGYSTGNSSSTVSLFARKGIISWALNLRTNDWPNMLQTFFIRSLCIWQKNDKYALGVLVRCMYFSTQNISA